MTTKSRPKNKTNIHVGQNVYDKNVDEYEITDLQVLSNKVIYAKVIGQKYNFKTEYDLIFINSRGIDVGQAIFGSNRDAKPFFIRKEDAALYHKGYTEDQNYNTIGYLVSYLIEKLKCVK